jgi:hypothetical protein
MLHRNDLGSEHVRGLRMKRSELIMRQVERDPGHLLHRHHLGALRLPAQALVF